MAENFGRFCWYELMTADRGAARAFYHAVVGWDAQDGPVPGVPYTMLTMDGRPVGGMLDMTPPCLAAHVPPHWAGYVYVQDVDHSARQAVELGGSVRHGPEDIPGVGRFAVIADPQGAVLALFREAVPGPDAPADMAMPGGIGWHELWAGEWEQAFAFYSAMFGWRKAEAMDMGEMGTYQLFAAGDTVLGGMFTKPASIQSPPFWLFYVNVDDIDAAARRVGENGGRITNGPMEVPGGGWIVQAVDPQGAAFALYGKRMAG